MNFKAFSTITLILCIFTTGCYFTAPVTQQIMYHGPQLPKSKHLGVADYFSKKQIGTHSYYIYRIYDRAHWHTDLGQITFYIPIKTSFPPIVESSKEFIYNQENSNVEKHGIYFYPFAKNQEKIETKMLESIFRSIKFNRFEAYLSCLLIMGTETGENTKLIHYEKNSKGKWMENYSYTFPEPISKFTIRSYLYPLEYLYAIPLDILTSPVQIPYVLVFSPFIFANGRSFKDVLLNPPDGYNPP